MAAAAAAEGVDGRQSETEEKEDASLWGVGTVAVGSTEVGEVRRGRSGDGRHSGPHRTTEGGCRVSGATRKARRGAPLRERERGREDEGGDGEAAAGTGDTSEACGSDDRARGGRQGAGWFDPDPIWIGRGSEWGDGVG